MERMKRDALKLALEFYFNPKLQVSYIRLPKLIDFENIRFNEPVNQSAWRLVFGEAPDSSIANNVDIGLYEGHCFYIKEMF